MKKTSLSFFVITAFAIYAVYQQVVHSSPADNSAVSLSLPAVLPAPVVVPAPTAPVAGQNPPTSPTPVKTPAAPQPAPTPTPPPVAQGQYKNGQYTGISADAYYGNIQVRAVISGGKLSDVIFLDYPHDRGTSIAINSQAMPYLKSEAIAAQSAQVDIVSGATDSSSAFVQSLASALSQAKN